MDHTIAIPGATAGSTSSVEPPVSRSLLAQVAHAAGDLRNPLGRQPAEGLLAAVRAAAAPGMWQPPGVDAARTPAPVAPVASPMAAAPPVPAPPPAIAAAPRAAPIAPQAVPAPAPLQSSASALWSSVAADLNSRSGLTAGGPQQPESGRLSFIEPRAGRSAGPLWDEVAEKLNAKGRAGATPEAPTAAAGGMAADLWRDVAGLVNADGRAASAGFIIPGQPHSARNAHTRISTC